MIKSWVFMWTKLRWIKTKYINKTHWKHLQKLTNCNTRLMTRAFTFNELNLRVFGENRNKVNWLFSACSVATSSFLFHTCMCVICVRCTFGSLSIRFVVHVLVSCVPMHCCIMCMCCCCYYYFKYYSFAWCLCTLFLLFVITTLQANCN